MMKYILIIISVILFSCSKPSKNISVKNYKLDFDCPQKSSFENFVSIDNIVELETTSESLIKSINRIIVRDSLIYIFHKKEGVKVFNISGKFKNVIGKKGIGPGELKAAFDFDLSPDGKTIAIWDRSGAKLSFYKPNGDFIKSVANKKVKYGHQFCWASENNLLFSSMYRKQEGGCFHVYRTDTLLTKFQGILPYDKRLERFSFSGKVFRKRENGDVLFRLSLKTEVYNVTAEPILESKLDIGSRAVPESRKLEYINNMDLLRKDISKGSFVFLHKYIEGSDWIYGFYHEEGEVYSVIIDKNTNKQSRYKHTASSDYLSNIAIIGNTSNQLIGRIEPYKLQEKFDGMLSVEKEKYKSKLKRWYEIMDRKDMSDNPILIFMTPK